MAAIHIPFERHFASPSEERLSDPDYLSVWGRESGGLRWNELYEYKCVVVLGEGKCGKTHEFKQQHKRLKAEGKFSFFVPLELLQDNDFLDTVSVDEEHEFERWRNETDKEAIFFLDAVDELKLRRGSLRKALRKIKSVIGAQAQRARFFISCRPNDWEQELDLASLADLIPPKEKKAETTNSLDGEEVFSAVIVREESGESPTEADEQSNDGHVKVLSVLPLTRSEVQEFSELYAPQIASEFTAHLEEKELWHLYQLPAEIISALDQLLSEGRLGNLEEQLIFGISQKLSEQSDKKRNSLSENRAMQGAERIALALFLMKRRSIYLDASGGNAEGVRVADILSDWPSEERVELLGKSLFDPTGVGAVRFHHRSTQEFLAARRMNILRESGLATADLFNLLFANIGDEKVIVPSMEPIAAWMALWNADILSEVKERNPLLLFRQGIPALLNLDLRAELIRRFVHRFAGSEWRQIGVGHKELKRVATLELAPVVREVWDQAYTGYDTRELLLELVYLTPMADCADLAFKTAFDANLPNEHRIYAVRAVLQCGTLEQKREIGASIVNGGWPERVIRNALPEMLPEAIKLEEFLELAQTLTEVPRSVHGLGYALYQTVKYGALTKAQKVIVRDRFSQVIWENRTAESRVFQAHSKFDHFEDALIAACDETVPSDSEGIPSWSKCLAVAFHFGERYNSIVAKDDAESLKTLLSRNVSLREGYYWACCDLVDNLEEPNDDRRSAYQIDYHRTLDPYSQSDFPWLLSALVPGSIEERRGVALHKLSAFVRDGANPELAEQIAELVADRAEWSEELKKILSPPTPKPDKYEIEHRMWKEQQKTEVAERRDGWLKWREKVLSSQDLLLGESDRENTLYNLYEAIQLTERDSCSWGHWNSSFVESAFSSEFFEKVCHELALYWRQTDVELYSERLEGSRNSFPYSSLMALSAVKCDAESPDWAKTLTHEDAVRAVRISFIELNGFAHFLPQVEAHHPQAVEEVIIGEVHTQITNLLNGGNAPILSEVFYSGTPHMKKVAASCVVKNIQVIEAAMTEDSRNDLCYAYKLVASQGCNEEVQTAVESIQAHLDRLHQVTEETRNYWTNILAQLDVESASEKILVYTNDLSTKELRDDAISLFATIFGESYRDGQPRFDNLEPSRRLILLQELTIRAYQVVQPQGDNHHEGSYRPNTRDHAEQARSYLLQCLATTNSPRTLSVLYYLSSLPEFTHLSDRLKQMATELAGRISEPTAMNAVTFRKFDQERNYLPYDNDSLFTVMNNRLADFVHHLINDEQSTVDTLRKVDSETELRRNISYWLNQFSRGAYTITQEAVVITEKRTDIRLHANGLDRYASIELKLDDKRNNWSGTQLRNALVNQLVGKYLNHQRCQVGCLLICMRESRRWQHPDTNKRMNLKETVTWLQTVADEIMGERPELLISVKGIDYSVTTNESDSK